MWFRQSHRKISVQYLVRSLFHWPVLPIVGISASWYTPPTHTTATRKSTCLLPPPINHELRAPQTCWQDIAFTFHLPAPAAVGFILTVVEQVLGFHFISIVEIFMCGWDRVVLQSASSFRHPFWVADAVKSKKTTWSSEMATHCLTHFCFQRTPGLKKKVDRPASHTTWPILCYLLLPKCKSFCSVTSPQMFLHSIWAEPMRASPNWGLAPVFLYPTFVAKQLIIFKSAGCFASYECSQEHSAEGRYSLVEDSCENLGSNLGQGVTSWCNQAWPSVGRTWKRPK